MTVDEHEPSYPLPDDVGLAHHEDGGGYLYRKGELLTTEKDAERVLETFRDVEWDEPRRVEGTHDVVLLAVRGDSPMDVPQMVDRVRSLDDPLMVTPNHVLCGGTHPKPHPARPPRPTGALANQPSNVQVLQETGKTRARVAVLDSGLPESNPWLGDRATRVDDARDLELPPPSTSDPLPPYTGHGMFIAGVVLQHAPAAEVLAVKVFDGHGLVTDTHLAAQLSRVPHNVDVINLSLGGPTHDNMGLPATADALRERFVINPDLAVVASAGNDGRPSDAEPVYPAAFKRVIAVGAIDDRDGTNKPACFTNSGWWVDACAPGVDVHSVFLNWSGRLQFLPAVPSCPPNPNSDQPQTFDGWALWDGTSFAAPRVAGAIAAAMQGQGGSAREAAFRVVHANPANSMPKLGTVVKPQSYY